MISKGLFWERLAEEHEALRREEDSSGGAPELPPSASACLELKTQALVSVRAVHTLNRQGAGGSPHDRIYRLQKKCGVEEATE